MLLDQLDGDAALQLDPAVGDQFRGPDIDVVSRTAAEVFHKQPRAVLAEIEKETRLLESRIEVSVAFGHLLVNWNMESGHDLVRHRPQHQIRGARRDPGPDGSSRVDP